MISFDEAIELYRKNTQEIKATEAELLDAIRRRQADDDRRKEVLQANASLALINVLAHTIYNMARDEAHARVLCATALTSLIADVRTRYVQADTLSRAPVAGTA